PVRPRVVPDVHGNAPSDERDWSRWRNPLRQARVVAPPTSTRVMMRLRNLLLPAVLPLVVAACATGAALDRLDQEGLFQYGMERLRNEDWSEAISAFERFTFTFPQDPRLPEARFRLGQAYQGRGEWVTAAVEFNRLAGDFPAGPWADDARFEVCRSYYELSPSPPRDQEYTVSAIDHCRSLISYYPDSEFVPRAQEMIQELVNKLAEKEF